MYKLILSGNANNGTNVEKAIDIQFEKVGTEKSNGTKNGEWLTHPAFTFGNTELPGIWVGKFETSNSSNLSKIVPNVSSLRMIILLLVILMVSGQMRFQVRTMVTLLIRLSVIMEPLVLGIILNGVLKSKMQQRKSNVEFISLQVV